MRTIQVITIITALVFLVSCDLEGEKYVKAYETGKADAANLDQTGCMRLVLAKIRECTSQDCAIYTNGYFIGCFQTAEKSLAVCKDVPMWEGTFNHVAWRNKQCAGSTANPEYCDLIYSTLQRECH